MPNSRCWPRAPALASAAGGPSCRTSTPAGAGRRRRSGLHCPAMTTAYATGKSSCALCLKFGWNDLRSTERRQGIWARSVERRKRPGPAPSALLQPALLEQLRAWWRVAGRAWGGQGRRAGARQEDRLFRIDAPVRQSDLVSEVLAVQSRALSPPHEVVAMLLRDDLLGAYLLVGGLNVVSLVDRLPVQHRSAFRFALRSPS